MAEPPHDQSFQTLPPVEVRRAAFARLTIYEVEESELEILAQGSPDSLYLNFSIFLLSTAIAFLVSLLTGAVETRVFIVFVVITTLGFLLGIFLLLLWLKKRRSVSLLVHKIKGRLQSEVGAEGIQADLFSLMTPEEAEDVLNSLPEIMPEDPKAPHD